MDANNNLDILLSQVCKVHTNKINKILEGVGLHTGQPILLDSLYKKDGVPQSVLSKELMITPATTSTMVKRLEKGGYVVRKRDAEDERVSNVYLTDAGREISSQLDEFKDTMEELTFNGFSSDEKLAMKNYFERILKNLSK